MTATYLVSGLVVLALAFGVVMNIALPVMQHQYSTAIWTVVGPILFLSISIIMYHFGIVHRAKRMIADNEEYEHENN